MKRIVLTGGPGAGKTVISTRLAAMWPERLVRVPEAATQVYDQLQTRWDRLDVAGRRDVQRRIYHLQIAQEEKIELEYPGKALLLDRGTVDGSAYWPEGPDDYWRKLGTTLAEQLARYNLVIWMQTGAVLGTGQAYDGQQSNPCRYEHPEAAIASGNLLRKLWSGHPNLREVEAHADLSDKIKAVRQLIEPSLSD